MSKKDDALDIVAQLLGNESKAKKKDTPSRKETTKDIASSKPIGYVEVIEVDDEEEKPRSRSRNQSLLPIFVTPEEYEKLGKPKFGYTTARINQFPRGVFNEAYYDILLEYYRASIKHCKLTKTIGWYETVVENKVKLCMQELEAFRVDNKLTVGDMGQILQIEYHYEYNRKKLTSRLIEVARLALEFKKKDDHKLTVNKLANVPPNVRPVLKYVKDVVNVEDEPELSVADILDEAIKVGPNACAEHPNYRGLRVPRNGCKKCMSFYELNKKNGVKEERNND